ncbi:phosphotransferase, partial [Mesorhizobium sp. M0767]|uniref:phosphotransferase n=1 Tax=Mesorhizobium sp. M0767 TaxID=2956995 RepID=UPI003335AC72
TPPPRRPGRGAAGGPPTAAAGGGWGAPRGPAGRPGPPVWVHGDVASGNLLVEDGKLCAVVDFGSSAIGDPACDLVIAWTEFYGESRQAFRAAIALDEHSWARARGWALWKALIVASGHDGNQREAEKSWRVIDEVLADHTNSRSGKANSV